MNKKFNDRLREYREQLKIKTKRDMAKKLKISEQLYYMLENGTREPSKDVLNRLYIISEKPEEYWKYGVAENEYLNFRDEFKSSREAIEKLYKWNLLDEDKCEDINKCPEAAKEVLLAAVLLDARQIIAKLKGEEK